MHSLFQKLQKIDFGSSEEAKLQGTKKAKNHRNSQHYDLLYPALLYSVTGT